MVRKTINRLLQDQGGTFVIEMAIVTPVLVMMAIGAFEVGTMISRQQELQSAIFEGESIALAANQGAETDLEGLKEIVKSSAGLTDKQVTLHFLYRCGTAEQLVKSKDSCTEDDIVSEYVNMKLQDIHEPIWVKFGLGTDISYDVERTVQLS